MLSTRKPSSGAALNAVERVVFRAIFPFQRAINLALRSVAQLWTDYLYLVDLKQENDELRRELVELRLTAAKLQEEALENQRLRRMYNIRQPATVGLEAARVIGRDYNPAFRSLMIDKGTDDGVRKEMAVLTPAGAVGRVGSAVAGLAKVLLLSDHRSSIDVINRRSRVRGIFRGQGGRRGIIDFVERTADTKVGDVIVTSGGAGVFPKGVTVGRVTRLGLDAAGIFQEIEVELAVDFDQLEEVWVVTAIGPRRNAFWSLTE